MNPSSNPEELINYLNNLNISEEINTFFSNNDKNQNGLVDADSFKNIFTELNQKIGIKEEMFGKKEWDWVLNLINKKSRDVLNKEEACKLYNQMVLCIIYHQVTSKILKQMILKKQMKLN